MNGGGRHTRYGSGAIPATWFRQKPAMKKMIKYTFATTAL